MTTEQVNIEFNVLGAAATRELNRVAEAEVKVKSEGDDLGAALETQIAGWGSFGTAVGQVGAVLSRVSPELAGFGAVLGQTGQSISTVATALASPNPASITSALVSVAATVADGIAAWQNYEAASRQTAAALQAVANAAKNADDNIAGLQRRQGREALAAGRASSEQAQTELAAQRERLESVEAALTAERDRVERLQPFYENLNTTALEFAEAERDRVAARVEELEVIENLASAQEALTDPDRAPTPRRGGAASAERRMSEEERFQQLRLQNAIQVEADIIAAQEEAQRQHTAWLLQEWQERAAEEQRIRAEVDADIAAVGAKLDQEKADQHDASIRRLEELKAMEQEASDELKAEAETVLGPVVNALTDAIGSVIAGTATAEEAFAGLLAAFLKTIAEQATISAIKEYAEAIAAFARYDYSSGAQHLAAGVAFTAVAVAAGVGAAVAAPSGAEAAGQPQAGDGGGGGGGPGNITYNINGTIISTAGASDRARAGRQVGALVNEGSRRFGRAA